MDKHLIFRYNNKHSEAFGVVLQNPIEISEAVPRVQDIIIPGRNGVLHSWDGTYNSRKAVATCYVASKMVLKEIRDINQWLVGDAKYKKLFCNDDDEHYFLARATNGVSEEIRKRIINPFVINFECRPEKFLVTGDDEITVTDEIYNPTEFPAHPIIKINGTGAVMVTINGNQLYFSEMAGEITLDTESGICSNPQKTTYTSDLVLMPGTNTVKIDGTATVKMIPRWWEL